jgi:hypothetical protein
MFVVIDQPDRDVWKSADIRRAGRHGLKDGAQTQTAGDLTRHGQDLSQLPSLLFDQFLVGFGSLASKCQSVTHDVDGGADAAEFRRARVVDSKTEVTVCDLLHGPDEGVARADRHFAQTPTLSFDPQRKCGGYHHQYGEAGLERQTYVSLESIALAVDGVDGADDDLFARAVRVELTSTLIEEGCQLGRVGRHHADDDDDQRPLGDPRLLCNPHVQQQRTDGRLRPQVAIDGRDLRRECLDSLSVWCQELGVVYQ